MQAALLAGAALLTICAIKLATLVTTYAKNLYKFNGINKSSYTNWFGLGHSLALQGSQIDLFETVRKIAQDDTIDKGQETTMIWIGPMPILVIVAPTAAAVVMRSSEHIKKSIVYDHIVPWLGTGLLISSGNKWKQRRRMLTPTFHYGILQEFLAVMNEQSFVLTSNLAKFADSNDSINMFQYITLCALDIICETAMGKKLNAQNDSHSDYAQAIYRVSEIIQNRQKSPWLHPDFIFYNTSQGREFKKMLSNVLHKFTKDVIKERRAEFSTTETKKIKRLAFLDLLLQMSNDEELSDQDIQEEADTFMFEGHDTTAAAMSFALHLIGKHPDVQDRMHAEIDAIFGGDQERNITGDDLRKLEYTEAVIKESLRLLPSVPFIGRQLKDDIEIDGHVIPGGTQCVIALYFINRNKNYWPNADKFDPDRFLSSEIAERHSYAYLPFSAGPRNCIGQRFAMMEEKVVVTNILRKYSLKSTDETDSLPLSSGLILRSETGINIKLFKR